MLERRLLASAPPEHGSLPVRVAKGPGIGWVYVFLAIQFSCQLALLIPSLAQFRIVWRSAAVGMSLLCLVLVPGRAMSTGSRGALLAVMGIVTLGAVNPQGGGPLAAVAQWAFYLAVIAPAFWAAR